MSTERLYDNIINLSIGLFMQTSTPELSQMTNKFSKEDKEFIFNAREMPLEERADQAWKMYSGLDETKSDQETGEIRWKILFLNLTDDVLDNLIVSFLS